MQRSYSELRLCLVPCRGAGTGRKLPVGSNVTIEGLNTNETYVFALLAYDSEGNRLRELGDSTRQVLLALPLPLYMCWSHLVLVASQLDCMGIAKKAGKVSFLTAARLSPTGTLSFCIVMT